MAKAIFGRPPISDIIVGRAGAEDRLWRLRVQTKLRGTLCSGGFRRSERRINFWMQGASSFRPVALTATDRPTDCLADCAREMRRRGKLAMHSGLPRKWTGGRGRDGGGGGGDHRPLTGARTEHHSKAAAARRAGVTPCEMRRSPAMLGKIRGRK